MPAWFTPDISRYKPTKSIQCIPEAAVNGTSGMVPVITV